MPLVAQVGSFTLPRMAAATVAPEGQHQAPVCSLASAGDNPIAGRAARWFPDGWIPVSRTVDHSVNEGHEVQMVVYSFRPLAARRCRARCRFLICGVRIPLFVQRST